MGLLDAIFAAGMPQSSGGFAGIPQEVPPDEEALAQAAREAAALRLAKGAKRPVNTGMPASWGGGDGMGLLGIPGWAGSDAAPAQQQPDLPPDTNDPESRQPDVFKDGVPLPRSRPDEQTAAVATDGGNPDGGGTDAAPTAPAPAGASPAAPAPLSLAPGQPAQAPAAPAAAAAAGGGISDILGKVFNPANAPTLLALGGGFAGAPSFGTGMSRAFSGAVQPAEALRKEQFSLETTAGTYRALVARGVPQAEALAAARDPDIKKAVVAKYFETKPRVPHAIGKDMLGNDIMGSFDPNTGKFYDAGGTEIKSGSAGGGTGSGGINTSAGLLAKGVTQYDPELPADEYLAQFSPDVQAGIKKYINGDTMPTSNPRLKTAALKVKEWAQTYGEKTGIPVSDSEFSRKRTMQNQIASSQPNSMGGILSNGKSAFGHLANLANNFVDLGNRSGPDIPGGSLIGYTANRIGNSVLPTPETSGKLEAVRDNAGKYGAEATKFYAGTGGGVEERLSALHGIAQPGTLATEQAAYLRTEKQLMLERLDQKEAQVRDVMGDRWLQDHPIRTPKLQHDIDRIDAAIQKLQTGAVGGEHAPAPATAGKTKNGITWSVH